MTAARTFAFADQLAFADVTADRNPIHVDPAHARRSIGGSCVVHGLHGLLWALDSLNEIDAILPSVRAISVRFQRMITIGTEVEARVASTSDKLWKVEIVAADVICTSISLKLGTPAKGPAIAPFAVEADLGRPTKPTRRELRDIDGARGRIAIDEELAAGCHKLFPKLCMHLGVECVGALALTSTVVGMDIPGLHSLYSELSVDFAEAPHLPSGLSFRASRVDERFRMATVELSARAFSGVLSAFVLFPPMVPPSAEEVARRVPADLFTGRHALVVGGSRGIGAVTAKIFAAGGGRVTVSYAEGKSQAEAVAADINAAFGEGRASTVQIDVTTEPGAATSEIVAACDTLYYFATPKISGSNKLFDSEMFEIFTRFYVDSFADLVASFVKAHGEKNKVHVFYPSTIYVADRPKGMTEYAMAKAAGEALCADLAKMLPKWTFEVPRIPRVATDQTLTVPPIKSEDPLDALLRIMDISAVG